MNWALLNYFPFLWLWFKSLCGKAKWVQRVEAHLGSEATQESSANHKPYSLLGSSRTQLRASGPQGNHVHSLRTNSPLVDRPRS